MQLENISKTIDKKEILTNISITVGPGEIVGLIGPNGAGKTTTMKIMSGLIVNFQGKVVGQERIGVLIDGPKYFPNRTARENLNYFRALSKESYSVDYVESLFDMKNYGKKKVKDFSLGMKQRLGMALALINKNELLILDEPMNGLDPDGVQATIQTLKHLAKELHIGIVISSHILGDLDKLCDRAYFIKNGAIIQTVTLGKEVSVYQFTFDEENEDKVSEISALFDGVEQRHPLWLISEADYPLFLKELVLNDIIPLEMKKHALNLEDVYFSLVEGE
ncbi:MULTISPECIES: ABC transporter ATP-binding protein [Enterococcus]|uniref:ABC transporter ATP-binding protein n=1 Tax=Enterococcus TaxID=1350 RepID=UPI0001CB2BCF|nr:MULTISPECIES: ABC transporter ATP-binding protein [Enterococcus]HAP3745774.1 ABC transporter ATP-binding protein [Enterococcus faecalis TDR28]HAP3751098.1 ABC transporter ATP-binding protein [Enterococcus faecalis TDR22]HAP3754097.1 ABC transporter ATP-binding protein [Enterococcus faecalis TDR13]HAP3757083.1 ABC transporter ATP-binding protein [Enterococcus faecalis TDR7]HAP3768687.1 ABC transporter ATP-binding protein [Enterococcus faecalis TDR19]HAP4959949.1 ABC transporter ATP-binding 